MGWQKLSPRSTRRIASRTGLDILHAASDGGYVHWFLTADHRHGWFDSKTGKWELKPEADPCTHTSCRTYFPEGGGDNSTPTPS